jgi:hypothetical protein
MTQAPESQTELTAVATDGPNRLLQVATWVGIVAGVVFVVTVIFFSGFVIGVHSGGNFGGHRDDDYGMYHHGGQPLGPGRNDGTRSDGPRSAAGDHDAGRSEHAPPVAGSD